nr:hypothetical protein BgiMline_016211 [Biomphalaria glabrata]
MCCCFKLPRYQRKDIVDLKDIMFDFTWNRFKKNLTSAQKLFLRKGQFEFFLPECSIVFSQVKYTQEDKQAADVTGVNSLDKTHVSKVDEPSSTDENRTGASLETVFDNDTKEKQTYKFRFEKTRKTVVTVSCLKSFTFGGKANFSVGIPRNVNLGLDSDLHFQVTQTDGQTFEETTLMEATSDITVSPHSKCTVVVYLDERPFHQEFTTVTRMSLPKEGVSVFIRRKSDKETVFGTKVENLQCIFDPTKIRCHLVDKSEGDPELQMDFETIGVIQGVIACKHKILLKSDAGN